MKMKCYILWIPSLISCFFLSGCIANQSLDTMSSSETNISNLWRISKGMNQSRVLQIMHKPFDYETFQFDEDTYDVWFYITRVTGLGQSRLVPQNLTPLTFKNGVLVDVGYVYYNYLVKEEQVRARTAATVQPLHPPPSSQELEDQGLENVLQTPSNGSNPAGPVKNGQTNPAPNNPAPSAPNQRKTNPSAPSTPSTPAKPATPSAPAAPKQTPSQSSPSATPVQKRTNPTNAVPGAPTQPSNNSGGATPQNQMPGRPSPNTPQPTNQLPGEPTRPTTTPSKNSSMTSMCSKPKTVSSELENDPADREQSASSQGQNWDEEDERMQEEESEQNFDYW